MHCFEERALYFDHWSSTFRRLVILCGKATTRSQVSQTFVHYSYTKSNKFYIDIDFTTNVKHFAEFQIQSTLFNVLYKNSFTLHAALGLSVKSHQKSSSNYLEILEIPWTNNLRQTTLKYLKYHELIIFVKLPWNTWNTMN